MWDVKFIVGASMRALPELERTLEEDFVTATAVIEQRPLLAGDAVTAALRGCLAGFRKKRSTAFLKYKLEELAKRRTEAGVSLFRMEPNLKTNPGCLRDVQLLRNIGFIVSGSRNLLHLTDLEVITRADLNGVLATNDHLLALRSLLHFHHKRKQDVFQLADQVRVAKQLGYADVSKLRAVEHFMKHHYAQVLHVHQMVDLTVSRLRAKGYLGGGWTSLIKTRRTLTEDGVAIQGQAYLSHAAEEFWRHPDAALRLFTLCRAVQVAEVRLSFELQRTIRAHLHVVGDDARRDPAIAKLFLEILGDTGRVHTILTDMHAAGLLGKYLPEFGNLTCHMQFDSYHQYTVDEHTLFALRNLDQVYRGQATGLPGMARMLPALKRRDLLALALLLHDVGKYMGRGHVARGAMMVEEVARRLHLDKEDEDLVHFLVEKHVALSDASRMRDIHEPSFLQPFSERIGSVLNLDYLYCLTWCDAKAVGEGVMTGWQEELLGELYNAIRGVLERSGAAQQLSRYEQVCQEFAKVDVPRAEAERFIADLPMNYLHQVQPAEVPRHWRIAARQREAGIGIEHELKDRYVFLALALPDRHALFADVAATLSGHGFDIIDARTWVTASGSVLYSFRLSSIYPARLKDVDVWQRLSADLTAVSAEKQSAEKLLAKRRASLAQPKPADSGFDDPAVKVEQATSEHATIVDVHTKDEVGLLSRLCRVISTHGCEILYACINTMGDVAVDVFYVCREGQKLSDDDAEALRLALIKGLNLRTEEGTGPKDSKRLRSV
jgi:[protein-PII] uridylyltransferase